MANGIQHYLLQRTGTSVVLSARQRLIRHLLRLPVADFDKRRTGDLVSRIGTDTTLLYAVLTQGLVDAAGGVVTFIGALIGMLLLRPRAARADRAHHPVRDPRGRRPRAAHPLREQAAAGRRRAG